jgi:hypothetical protein
MVRFFSEAANGMVLATLSDEVFNRMPGLPYCFYYIGLFILTYGLDPTGCNLPLHCILVDKIGCMITDAKIPIIQGRAEGFNCELSFLLSLR